MRLWIALALLALVPMLLDSSPADAGRTRTVPEGVACPRSDAEIDERGCPVGFWVLSVPEGQEPPADPCAEIRRLCDV